MNRRSVAAIVTAATVVAATLSSAVGATASGSGAGTESGTEIGVIVQAADGDVSTARNSFVALGGDVTRTLPIIGGFSGTIDEALIDDVRRVRAISSVTPDADVTPMAVDPVLGYDPASTTSMSAITQITGAQAMWNAGFTGRGVDVAVIDTGVARVPGLDQVGKVIDGPDLSFDNLEPTLRNNDAFGHGTHMAGIIAGTDVAPGTSARKCKTCLGRSPYTDVTKFVGVAPEARIINVKAGAFDGAADVSQIIAAIDWVVQHRSDPGMNIRVLNLSFGTDSTQSAALDPLVFAAEQAWKAGIVVVVAAGNDGLMTASLANPALSPMVIAVGASDPRGTLTTSDDIVPSFAQHGSATRSVDVVAPGISVIGLRVPNGFVDQAVTTGKIGSRFQQASGTSQSTAIVSGLAALVVSKFPTASPDAVKAYLMGTAQPIASLDAGTVSSTSLKSAVELVNTWYSGSGSAWVGGSTSLPVTSPQVSVATGLGSLEAARGSYHVSNGVSELRGELDIMGTTWNPTQMAALTVARATWTGGIWNGVRWSGDDWSGVRWKDADWTNTDWSGVRWTGVRWKDATWSSGTWSGVRWKDASWSSGTWSGARWSGARWSDANWS